MSNPYIRIYTDLLLDEYEEYTCASCGTKKKFLIQKSTKGNQCIKHQQYDEDDSWQLLKIEEDIYPLCPDCYYDFITEEE